MAIVKIFLYFLAIFFAVVLTPASSFCGEVKGKVVQVRGKEVTIRLESPAQINKGDNVELSYTVAGEVIGVGTWKVSAVNSDGTVEATPVEALIDPTPTFDAVIHATGSVAEQKPDGLDGFAKSKKNVELQHACDEGDVDACYELGVLYQEDGLGVSKDKRHSEAARLFHKAATKGHAGAQKYLGTLYETGSGVEQSDSKAIEWYRKAAQQGVAVAQWTVGIMLTRGKGVPKDAREAIKWFQMAANQKFPWAYSNVGFAYAFGQGVPEDLIEGYKWYEIAASSGETDYRMTIAPLMTAQQIAEAKRLAREWLHRKW